MTIVILAPISPSLVLQVLLAWIIQLLTWMVWEFVLSETVQVTAPPNARSKLRSSREQFEPPPDSMDMSCSALLPCSPLSVFKLLL